MPELFRELIKEGAKLIFCPSYWFFGESCKLSSYRGEIERVNSLCQTRAFENEIFLVFVNAVGKTPKNKKLIGQTQIAHPFSSKTKRLDDKREGILFDEIDFEDLEKAEKIYKIREDLKNLKFFKGHK